MSSRSLISNDIALPTVLYALSDPIRLKIVRELAATTEESCGDSGIEVATSHELRNEMEGTLSRVLEAQDA